MEDKDYNKNYQLFSKLKKKHKEKVETRKPYSWHVCMLKQQSVMTKSSNASVYVTWFLFVLKFGDNEIGKKFASAKKIDKICH